MENEKTKSSAIEFDFDSQEQGGGLVFEREEPKGLVFETAGESPETPVSKKSEIPEKTKTPTDFTEPPKPPQVFEKKAEEPVADVTEEFSVPEVFEVNEKYNTPIKSEDRTRIYTTYVPRFTGASDNYRMKDDPRPRPKVEEPVVTAKAEEATEIPSQTVVAHEKPEVVTAPLEQTLQGPVETVMVNVPSNEPDSLDGDSFNFFKFPSEDAKEERISTKQENENRRALEEMKARQTERRAREEAERLAREEAEEDARRERANMPPPSPEDYTIPDPEQTTFNATGITEADYDTPHGIPESEESQRSRDKSKDGEKKRRTEKRRGAEYKKTGERDAFKDKFLDSLVSARIRIIASSLFALALLFLENASFVDIDVEALLGIEFIPSALAIIDFLLVLCVFLLALPEVLRTASLWFSGVVMPETASIVAFATAALHTLATVFTGAVGYYVFGFVTALSLIFAMIGSHLRKKSEFESFKTVSVAAEKKILEHEEIRNYPRIMLALDGAVDGYKSEMARTFRTNFVTDFFKNSAKTADRTKNNIVMLSVTTGAALIVALISFVVSKTNPLYHAAASLSFVTAFSVPVLSYLAHKLPRYYADAEVAAEGGAMIGEGAYIDTADVDVIAFEDVEIFGEDDVNLKRFGFYGNEENMSKSMRLVSSVFAAVGGPLDTIFSKTVERRYTPATNAVIEDDGVSGNVDGKIVYVGTSQYMDRHGIKIPTDNDRTYGFGAESAKTMYAAEGGAVFAKFYIRYSFSEEFASLLPSLKEEGVVPLVYTSDPNVSNELLRTLTMGEDSIRVMKRKTARPAERIYPRISSLVVANGDKLSVGKIVLISKKYKRFVNKLSVFEIITASLIGALAVGLALAGLIGIPTAAFGAVSVISALSLQIAGRKKFNAGKKRKGN